RIVERKWVILEEWRVLSALSAEDRHDRPSCPRQRLSSSLLARRGIQYLLRPPSHGRTKPPLVGGFNRSRTLGHHNRNERGQRDPWRQGHCSLPHRSASMEIRTYQSGDDAAQVSIYNEAAGELPKFKAATLDEVRRRARAADHDPTTRFLALEGEQAVG